MESTEDSTELRQGSARKTLRERMERVNDEDSEPAWTRIERHAAKSARHLEFGEAGRAAAATGSILPPSPDATAPAVWKRFEAQAADAAQNLPGGLDAASSLSTVGPAMEDDKFMQAMQMVKLMPIMMMAMEHKMRGVHSTEAAATNPFAAELARRQALERGEANTPAGRQTGAAEVNLISPTGVDEASAWFGMAGCFELNSKTPQQRLKAEEKSRKGGSMAKKRKSGGQGEDKMDSKTPKDLPARKRRCSRVKSTAEQGPSGVYYCTPQKGSAFSNTGFFSPGQEAAASLLALSRGLY
jgi:hypothetical protein